MKRYIIAIDEGTTSCRAGLFDIKKNKFLTIQSKSFKINYPNNAWVEFDANEIWEKQKSVLLEIIKTVDIDEVFSLGLTNQRESVVAWDKRNGEAVYPSICWQCRRTDEDCSKLEKKYKQIIQDRTGLIIDPYFSATKFQWLLNNNKQVKSLAKSGNLCLGTIDSFLIFKLTNGKVFATDTTNASRTMLFNLKNLDWDNELLRIFKIKREWLPKIVSSSEFIGNCEIFEKPISICGVIGDQQSALVGQSCFKKGMAKNTYGTGCFMLINTGDEIVKKNNLISTIAYSVGGKTAYAVEGSVLNAGSLVEWLKSIGLINSAGETQKMAMECQDNGGVYLVPAFTGLGAPYWDTKSRGAFLGITRATTKNHLVRAVLESMAYSTYDIISALDDKFLKEMRCDGGASNNEFLMQFQSDLLNINIKLPKIFESTLLGAVYMAGLSSGAYKNFEEIENKWQQVKEFKPLMDKKQRKLLISQWHDSINRVLVKNK